MEPIKPYKKGDRYSYTLGAFPTIELIKSRPELVREVLVHSTFTDTDHLQDLCMKNNIPLTTGDKTISRLSDKENCFVVGVFERYEEELDPSKPHIVLVNPSNMGNLGTILRTAVAMGIYDIGIITPAVDEFHPKSVRASMGALFRLRHECFSSFTDYQKKYGNHEVFCFMLTGRKQLTIREVPKPKLFSLVFGNEATGLPKEFENYGESILIPQSPDVDSLNLTIAVGIGSYVFMQERI